MQTKTAIFSLIHLLVCTLQARAETRLVQGQYPNIQAAIDACTDGDTVIVTPGAYAGDGNHDIGFQAKAITLRSQSGAENFTLDCQGSPSDPHSRSKKHSPTELRAKTTAVTLSPMPAKYDGAPGCTKSLGTRDTQRNHTIIQFFEGVHT